MDKHSLHGDDIGNNTDKPKEMKVKDQMLSLLLNILTLILISLVSYAYVSDKNHTHEKIDDEVLERKEACNSIKLELGEKVDKSQFNEFKAGQVKIQEYINSTNKERQIYQDIIRKLSFMDIDTVNINYEKFNLYGDGNIQ